MPSEPSGYLLLSFLSVQAGISSAVRPRVLAALQPQLPLRCRAAVAPAPGAWSRHGLRTFASAAAAPAVANAKQQAAIVKEAHGFELVRQQFVKEYDSTMLLYRHKKTGACQLPGYPTVSLFLLHGRIDDSRCSCAASNMIADVDGRRPRRD